ncbi:Arc family DNA-binding protein [Shewanella sp. Koi 1]
MTTRNPQINIRVPEHVKAGLHHAAELSGRSVNSEIVFRLEQSFGKMPIDKLVPASEAKSRAKSLVINSIEERLVSEIISKVNKAIINGESETSISPDDHQPESQRSDVQDAYVETINRVCSTLEKLGYKLELKEAERDFQKTLIIIRF